MSAPDLAGLAWRKSSRSNGNGNVCVEIARTPAHGAVRDSKNPAGPMLVFAGGTLTSFLDAAKQGAFDRG
ncbi:DUF397 domain-containing protein [Gandjariella thermophila]|uniref:DUF397 domain-containing protein n=1 Tax=Gandjariella thermophila TaxID=1931992 RepID=A0A4D4J6D1_9PSEU|nr:DUF397 domain-containing protein [Gandjariella thermophila]GDY30066.1 hypothetical protein GTS_16990 [Gandjariella thermophila]